MIVDINGARIHYRREGAGFPILMFHAGIADSRMWQPQADEFAKQFDVIRPDMRGFGDSELPPRRWSPVGDVIALIDELGLKPAHVIGCSLGGGLAVELALDHPARISKLVLVGPSVSGANFGKKYPELRRDQGGGRREGPRGIERSGGTSLPGRAAASTRSCRRRAS